MLRAILMAVLVVASVVFSVASAAEKVQFGVFTFRDTEFYRSLAEELDKDPGRTEKLVPENVKIVPLSDGSVAEAYLQNGALHMWAGLGTAFTCGLEPGTRNCTIVASTLRHPGTVILGHRPNMKARMAERGDNREPDSVKELGLSRDFFAGALLAFPGKCEGSYPHASYVRLALISRSADGEKNPATISCGKERIPGEIVNLPGLKPAQRVQHLCDDLVDAANVVPEDRVLMSEGCKAKTYIIADVADTPAVYGGTGVVVLEDRKDDPEIVQAVKDVVCMYMKSDIIVGAVLANVADADIKRRVLDFARKYFGNEGKDATEEQAKDILRDIYVAFSAEPPDEVGYEKHLARYFARFGKLDSYGAQWEKRGRQPRAFFDFKHMPTEAECLK